MLSLGSRASRAKENHQMSTRNWSRGWLLAPFFVLSAGSLAFADQQQPQQPSSPQGQEGMQGTPGMQGQPGMPGREGMQGQPGMPGGEGMQGQQGTKGQRGMPGQPGQMQAPIAGTQPIGVTVEEDAIVARGWSGRKNLLNKPVYNDRGEKIGKLEDVIISPDKTASFAIVSTASYVGMSKHDVAIPFDQLQLKGERIMLPGGSKDALKALPEFVYAK
jgi:sporulation protein YlmC with PRC-barrel domain